VQYERFRPHHRRISSAIDPSPGGGGPVDHVSDALTMDRAAWQGRSPVIAGAMSLAVLLEAGPVVITQSLFVN
jgi:hypothetical protein